LYNVYPFSGESLAFCLANQFTTVSEIKQKGHFTYLLTYLTDLGVNTIVVEDEYVSKDYLHDYTSYYSLCFEAYPKYCKRIHFFQSVFNTQAFDSLVLGTTPIEPYQAAYIGFTVARPIPHAVIGFTALKTYGAPRTFWAVKNYPVNLFGLSFHVASLAFQEQDSVVAACATAAIWSMLHGAVQNGNHAILLKSPSEITKNAGNSSDGHRLFPNTGLEVKQISESIFNAGLVCEIKSEDESVSVEFVKKIVNAYSGIGIPIILVVNLSDQETHGLHAVTVCGFHKEPPKAVEVDTEMSFMSDNITKLYAHDDQWGPFARIEFTDEGIITPWNEQELSACEVQFDSIIVAVYPKIRISYEDIDKLVRAYDFILSILFNAYLELDLVWDIRLVMNTDYRKMVQDLDPGLYPQKLQLLTESRPKYIWIASCYVADEKILDITFDATGVSQAMLALNAISYMEDSLNTELVDFLRSNKTHDVLTAFHGPSSEKYYDFLVNAIAQD